MRKTLPLLLAALGLAGRAGADAQVTGPGTAHLCESESYAITATNTSTSVVSAVRVQNDMPPTGFTYVAGSGQITAPGCSTAAAPAVAGNRLTWDVDAQCAASITLAPGQSLTVDFGMSTSCSTVSGSDNVRVDYLLAGVPAFDTGALSVEILPGAVTVTKTPSQVPAPFGGSATWTLRAENTGLGRLHNVVLTDLLGAGLSLVSTSVPGVVAGQTITWTSAEIPALAVMQPGDTVSIDITATVIACQLLDDVFDARWGCGAGPTCFDTATDGGTATASVELIIRNPNVQVTLSPVTLAYCGDSPTYSFPVTNVGDGMAHNIDICVDLGPLAIVSSSVPYTAGCFQFGDLSPGASRTLDFSLRYADACAGAPSGSFVWRFLYQDDCGNDFFPPTQASGYSGPASSPSVTTSKTGPVEIELGSALTYQITAAYSGPITCGSGTTGTVTVTDTLPTGFTVLDPGGGVWTPGGGGTGGTIVWTFASTAGTFSANVVVQAPALTDCSYCFTTFANSVTATVTDCCACTRSSTATATSAIECQQLLTSDKTVAPASSAPCGTLVYTNTYRFADDAALDPVSLSTIVFRELASNAEAYVPGSLVVTLDGAPQTCVVTDGTPAGDLVISGCTGGSVRNRTLVYSYSLSLTAGSAPSPACGAASYYSWSEIDLGITGGNCLGDGTVQETTQVSVSGPTMDIAFTGMPFLVEECGTFTPEIVIRRTGGVDRPRDVVVRLDTTEYFVLSVDGYTPAGSPPLPPVDMGTYFEWSYGDLFTTLDEARIRLTIRKRCGGTEQLSARVLWDNQCTDDATSDGTCQASATYDAPILLAGDLLIEKTPEVIYADQRNVQWRIYVTNRGDGPAHNVWLDDILGSGLRFVSASVVSATDTTVTANLDHTGGIINGATIGILRMEPAERRQITLVAELIACTGLTNDVTTSWGCIGGACRPPKSDSATVVLPDPVVINTSIMPTPVESCATNPVSMTVKNAGKLTVYDVNVLETLPVGLEYVPGSTEFRINAGPWTPLPGGDPTPVGLALRWTMTQVPALAVMAPNTILEIRIQAAARCTFGGGTVTVVTSYANPCGRIFSAAASNFTVTRREPNLSIDKVRIGPPSGPLSCGENVTWEIRLRNNSTFAVPVVWVEDTLGAAFTYVSSVGSPPFSIDNGSVSGQTVTWELRNLPALATATLTLTATTDISPCSTDLANSVRAYWGCGAADGSSGTNPAGEPGVCLGTTAVADTDSSIRQPGLSLVTASLAPVTADACSGNATFTATFRNSGRTAAGDVDLRMTLPTGMTYLLGSTVVTCPIGGGSGDPQIAGQVLTFYDLADNLCDQIPANGGEVSVQFAVTTDCFVSAVLPMELSYFDCCGASPYTANFSPTVTSNQPVLTISKTPDSTPLDCGNPLSTATWTIRVTNTGTGPADWVSVRDTLGTNLAYVSSSPAATSLGGQVYGWEFGTLAAGSFQDVTITARATAPATCTASLLRDTAVATWGCSAGVVDGDPATTADYSCQSGISVTDTADVTLPNLAIASANVTPALACSADGANSATLTVVVRNTGGAPLTSDFVVRIADNVGTVVTGNFSTFAGGTLPIAAGGSRTITVPWPVGCTECTTQITVTLDQGATLCECNEADNAVTVTWNQPSRNLRTLSIAPSCSADGQSSVAVVIENTGCSDILTPFTVRLSDNLGHTATQTVASLARGATATLTFAAWATDCTASVAFTAVVDDGSAVCECDGTDNTTTLTYANASPDLVVTSVSPASSCSNDAVSASIAVTVENRGNAAAGAFNVTVTDNVAAAFTGTQAVAGLAAGASTTLTFPWTRADNFLNVCAFPNIVATVDPGAAVCECSGAANTLSASHTVAVPDLRVVVNAPACTADGTYNVGVNVTNAGACAAATNVPVRLADNDGNTANQTVANLAAGATQTVTFTNWPADGTPATLAFTATVDPAPSTICERSGGNNTGTRNYTRSNLAVVSVAPACTSDGTYRVVAAIQNTGTVAINANFNVRVDDNDGHTVTQTFTAAGGTLPLGAGATQTLTFAGWTVDCAPTALTFTVTADTGNAICESAAPDNSRTAAFTVDDVEATSVTAASACAADGVSGSISVVVTNRGGAASTAAFDVTVDDGQGFTATQTVPAGLAAGAATSVVFPWTRSFVDTCAFPTITARVDPTGTICECSTANNLVTTSHTVAVPDPRVTALAPVCSTDGSYSVAVTVTNPTACAAAANLVVRLSDDDGQSQDQTIASLPAGGTQTLTYAPWPADGNPATLTFTATADPLGALCERSGTNNATTASLGRPNLRADLVTPTCAGDGSYQVAVTVTNTGAAAVTSDFQIRLTDTDGRDVTQAFTALGGTLPFVAGTSQTVTFAGWNVDCSPASLAFTVTLDASGVVCEGTPTDNSTGGSLDLSDLEATALSAATACGADGSITGTLSLTVTNRGSVPATADFDVAFDDGRGFTQTTSFTALGGALPLAPSTSQTVSLAWGGVFTGATFCDFPTIRATIQDPAAATCECSLGNNTVTTTHALTEPNLALTALGPTCSADGSLGVTVEVSNSGCGAATNAVVRLADDDGQSQDQTIASLGVGATQTLSFSPWPADGTPATLTFTATADPGSLICELTGADNVQTALLGLPNLRADLVTPTCAGDGSYQVAVTLTNTGSAAVTSDFQIRLTDTDGRDVTQAFTALGGTLPFAAGTSQTVTFAGWNVDCSPASLAFTVTLDSGSVVCEGTPTDNSTGGSLDLSDLEATALSAATACGADGSITGTLSLTVTNRGSVPAAADFDVAFDDGRGFTQTTSFTALGGTLPLLPGASQTVSLAWGGVFTGATFCDFPTIRATIQDPAAATCECSLGNNTVTTTHALTEPNLALTALGPTCSADGSLGVTVGVSNSGCGAATNAVVRLSDDDGQSQDQTIASLGVGATQTLTFSPWPADGTPATLTFTATADPGSLICELTGADNVQTALLGLPNLRADLVTPTCAGDGSYQVAVTLTNTGATAVTSDFQIRLTDTDGRDVTQAFTALGGTLPFVAGTSQTVTFAGWNVDCSPASLAFTVTIDSGGVVCEGTPTDNSTGGSLDLSDLEATALSAATACGADGSITGTLSLTVTNRGSVPATADFDVAFDDGRGFIQTTSFTALGGTLPLLAGASQTVSLAWGGVFTGATFCDFPTIRATIQDPAAATCECSLGNNTVTTTHALTEPDLVATGTAAACDSDGRLRLAATLRNAGCGPVTSDFDVRLTDSSPRTVTQSFASMGGALPIAPGETRTLTVLDWPFDCTTPSLTFAAALDTSLTVCELDPANNSSSTTVGIASPDLVLVGVAPTCQPDTSATFAVTVANQGAADAPNVTVIGLEGTTVFDTVNLSLAAGATQVVTLNVPPDPIGVRNFRVVVDNGSTVCECNAANNELAVTTDCGRPGIVTQKRVDPVLAGPCNDVTFALVVNNVGRVPVERLEIRDSLPPGFGYIPGTTTIEGVPGAFGVEPTVNGRELLWTLPFGIPGGEPLGATLTLRFRAETPSCADGSRSMVNRFSVVSYDRLGRPLPLVGTDPDDSDPDDASSVSVGLECPSVAMASSCTAGAIVAPGGVFEYSLDVAASGAPAGSLGRLEVRETLTAGLRLVSATVEGAQALTSPAAGTSGPLSWTFAGETLGTAPIRIRLRVRADALACGQTFASTASVNAADACGAPLGGPATPACSSTIVCDPEGGVPDIAVAKSCPATGQPGSLLRFEVQAKVVESTVDVVIEDVLPPELRYAVGSTLRDGARFADPLVTGNTLRWNLGPMAAGQRTVLTYAAGVAADVHPDRTCNRVTARGLVGGMTTDASAECCTVLRQEAAGCCLDGEDRGVEFVLRPDSVAAVVEPYFHTEEAMLASYAALGLWSGAELDRDGLPSFVRERVKSQALSSVEELYLRSSFGVAKAGVGLAFSAAGGEPRRGTDGTAWERKNVDREMTLAQVAAEVLALLRAIPAEDQKATRETLERALAHRLAFVAQGAPVWAHSWTLDLGGQSVGEGRGEATRRDLALLVVALGEARSAGRGMGASLDVALTAMAKAFEAKEKGDPTPEERLLEVWALAQAGRTTEATSSLTALHAKVARGEAKLDGLATESLSVFLAARLGVDDAKTRYATLKQRYYRSEIGLMAEDDLRQDDVRRANRPATVSLAALAPTLLAVGSQASLGPEAEAPLVFRMAEQSGLFLASRAHEPTLPPLWTTRHDPTEDGSLPVRPARPLPENAAPVFTRSAVLDGSYPLAPELSRRSAEVVAPKHETSLLRVGRLSAALQLVGDALLASDTERQTRESGRTIGDLGRHYLRTMAASGAGLVRSGSVVLPFDEVANTAPREEALAFEGSSTRTDFSTETVAAVRLAESLAVAAGETRLAPGLATKDAVLTRLTQEPSLPARFLVPSADADGIARLVPRAERASRRTLLLLAVARPGSVSGASVASAPGELEPSDLVFLARRSALVPLFRSDVERLTQAGGDGLAGLAGRIVAARLLGRDSSEAQKRLADAWDRERGLPPADRREPAGRSVRLTYDPESLLLGLVALDDAADPRHRRALQVLARLVESEWDDPRGRARRLLPAAAYWVLDEPQRQQPEPGDRMHVRVRIDNTCPVSSIRGVEVGNVQVATDFTPALGYGGTEDVAGLLPRGGFRWSYERLAEGGWLEYSYEALLPRSLRDSSIDRKSRVRGGTGDLLLGPGTEAGRYCEDFWTGERWPILPLRPLMVRVFEDTNANGRLDPGEPLVPGVALHDARGNAYRTDAEGRVEVPVGTAARSLQLDVRTVPEGLLLATEPTLIVDREYEGEPTFGLIRVVDVQGRVYRDANANGRPDEGEERLQDVLVGLGGKLVASDGSGGFLLHNVPVMLVERVATAEDQPFRTDSGRGAAVEILSVRGPAGERRP